MSHRDVVVSHDVDVVADHVLDRLDGGGRLVGERLPRRFQILLGLCQSFSPRVVAALTFGVVPRLRVVRLDLLDLALRANHLALVARLPGSELLVPNVVNVVRTLPRNLLSELHLGRVHRTFLDLVLALGLNSTQIG